MWAIIKGQREGLLETFPVGDYVLFDMFNCVKIIQL